MHRRDAELDVRMIAVLDGVRPAPTLTTINRMDRDAFVDAFGDIFEHSPWVAEGAWPRRPFSSVDDLHAAMLAAAATAPLERQVALFNAHPELAGKEAVAGTLTTASTIEQASAGLDALRLQEIERLAFLNGEYRARHGFPFIICVRHYTKRGIFFELGRRLARETFAEVVENLAQIGAITRVRLESRVDESAL